MLLKRRILFRRLGLVDPGYVQVAFGDLVAFQLRLGHPGENVVVATDVGDEMHGLAAPGIAVAGLAVPLLLRQARQHLLHIQPLVRVQALFLGQLARIVQVAGADVIGGQGEPGAVRFLDLVVQLFLDIGQVLGPAADALLGVQAVGNAHGLGRVLGQHHQPAHPGLGGDLGLPHRFLIAHRRQQAPVELFLLGRRLEVLLVLGQALLQVLGKGVGADIAEHVHMAVVAVLQALQGAVLLDLVEETVDLVEQAVVVACGHGPALAAGIAQVKGHSHIGEVDLVHRQFVGVHQGQVDLPFVHHAQQVHHFHGVRLFVFDAGVLELEFRQLFGVGAALEHHDVLAHQVLRGGGAGTAIAIDDLGRDFQIGVGEPHLLLALLAAHQAGGGQDRALGLAQLVE